MKLKKIVSLALAGVLAVSMLAGCSNGTGSSSSTPTQEAPAAAALTNSVIAQLSKGTTDKVTFTYDAGVNADLEKIVAYYGTSTDNSLGLEASNKVVLSKFGLDATVLPVDTKGDTVNHDDDEVTTTQFVFVKASDTNATYTAKKIANEVETTVDVSASSTKLNNLPANGAAVKTADDKDCFYAFNYTGKMAVVAVSDAYDHVTGYAVLFSVTRTGTQKGL